MGRATHRTEKRVLTPFSCPRTLPAEKVVVVEDFVDCIRQRDDSQLTHAFSKLSEGAFKKVWDNPDDVVYDRL
jgi:hypothetical protein